MDIEVVSNSSVLLLPLVIHGTFLYSAFMFM